MFTMFFACAATRHPTLPVELPTDAAAFAALVDVPGPLTVESVASADWAVPLSGVLDLTDPATKGMEDRDEPIHVFFHAVHHPTYGLSLIDSGVEEAVIGGLEDSSFRGPVAKAAGIGTMVVNTPLGPWIGGREVRGMYLTHLHLDHVAGLADLPAGTPVWTGPGEASAHAVMHAATRGIVDRELADLGPLQEMRPVEDPTGRFAGLVDVLGDGSLWGIWTPGHTPGSMAYLARTTTGPVLFSGDTCHTRWGWEHDVAPGTFTMDAAQNRVALQALKALVAEHPSIEVRFGHQW